METETDQEHSSDKSPKTVKSKYESQQLTSRQMIEKSLEEMISEMNDKRTRDQAVLQNFKQDLDQWCAKTHAAVEAAVYERTVKSSEAIDKKLAELVEALGRIRKVESEMDQFRQKLGAFCADV